MEIEVSRFRFAGRTFKNFDEMLHVLLTEVNQQLRKIASGEVGNTLEARKYLKWRLLSLQHHCDGQIPLKYRGAYNSYWSQVYRLEHEVGYRHPYLAQLMARLIAASQHGS